MAPNPSRAVRLAAVTSGPIPRVMTLKFATLIVKALMVWVGVLISVASQAVPVVPGFDTEIYTALPGPMLLSFGSAGELYVGRHPEEPAFVRRIGPGGTPTTQ